MKNNCANCGKKIVEHIWILISWLISVICGFVSFIYRKDSEKTAIIIFIDKILTSLTDLLSILKVPICCKMKEDTKSQDPIEDCKKLIGNISVSNEIIEKLKQLAANGNQDAKDLLKNLKTAGQNMINII